MIFCLVQKISYLQFWSFLNPIPVGGGGVRTYYFIGKKFGCGCRLSEYADWCFTIAGNGCKKKF